jgi:DNA polymerase (family 10)
MARPNEVVAALLQEYADLISITGGDGYRVRVYDRAARSVAGHHADVSTLDHDGLRQIPNVGGAIADKILEYLHSGRIAAVEKLRAKAPAGVRELTAIPTLGPRKAMQLYQELGVSSVPELAQAIEQGRLAGLRGFGPKTADNLRHGIELLRRAGGRVLISTAMAVAEEVVGELSTVAGCVDCRYAGSLRRFRESIDDVDVLAAAPSR